MSGVAHDWLVCLTKIEKKQNISIVADSHKNKSHLYIVILMSNENAPPTKMTISF